MSTNIYTGLDIGTTKVCAVIVKEEPEGRMNVVGIGSAPSHGLRKGVVVNIEQTVQSVQQALNEAEHMAGVEVESAVLIEPSLEDVFIAAMR